MHTATDPEPLRVGSLADHLDGAPRGALLPTDRPAPAVRTAAVDGAQVSLDGALVGTLEALASGIGSDIGTALLAAWRVLLRRTTGESDLVVGCWGLTAPSRAGELVVVRAPVALDAPFPGVLRATADAVEAAAPHARAGVEHVVQDLGLEPGPGKHPVFRAAFAATGGARPAWPGTWPVPPDVVLSWWRADDDVRVRLDWSMDLFDRWRMERLLGHLLHLLAGAVDEPARAVAALPLLGDEELAELESWNATACPHDAGRPLAARVWDQAQATPDAAAVEMDGQVLTYAQLTARAAELAAVLRADGVDSDVVVAVSLERSVEMVVAVLAVLMAGGAYVPVDPAYPASRRQLMVEDSGARLLLTSTGRADDVAPAGGARALRVDQPFPEVPADPEALRGRSGHDLGFVIYTSGSTGRPKGVAMPQSALDNLIAWQMRRPQFVAGARTLQFSSLSFDVSFQELFSTWSSGGTLVLVDEATRRDPLRLLDHILRHRVQRIFLPFVALRGLAAAAASTGRVPTSLREVYTAGEQLQVDPVVRSLFQALPGCVLENQYGPSESHVVTAHTLGPDPAAWPVLPPIGAPIDNSSVHVLDEHRERRPVGVPGELYLAGACLARGYLGRPDLTDERFVPASAWVQGGARMYRTGDLARWLPTGEVEFLGRLDHQVKFRGYRIEPAEVGAVLSSCPGVGQCVAAVRDSPGGARLTAYVVPADGQAPDLGLVHRYARDNLPDYMVPSHYLVLPALPLTASGKVDTMSLPDAEFDRGILSTPHRAPSNHEEQVLAEIWSSLLGVPEVGVLDDFFELGGDSLVAAEMVQQVADRLGRELPLGGLAKAPTVAGLAATLRDSDDQALWRSLVPLQPGAQGVTPLFIVHGGSGNVATFPKLARELPSGQPVYGLQWDGLDGNGGQLTVEAMATHYLEEVRTVQEQGPYLLAGQCIGGLVAREMARQLLTSGERVDLLVMYDSPNLHSDAYVPVLLPPVKELVSSAAALRKAARQAALVVWRRLPTRDPVRRSSRAMRQAALRYRTTPLPESVPTHYVATGESQGSSIALSGHWTDGAMGWASQESHTFTVHRIAGDHNHVLYDPRAVTMLVSALGRCQDGGQGSAVSVAAEVRGEPQ